MCTYSLDFVICLTLEIQDPMLILTHSRRKLGFLIAAKSMKRKVVGWFASKLYSIPVVRGMDMATPGEGVVSIKGNRVYGTGTLFVTDFPKGNSIILPEEPEGVQIKEILSDTEMIIGREYHNEYDGVKYSILPKLDYSKVYDEVWNRLGSGEGVGIFPEGGSHDRTELLPLKAGVTLMALGAMEKYGTQVQIVPCGLNYFSGHRFRSFVVIEFGKPYKIPQELVDLYKKQKRAACSQLLEKTRELLLSVTLNTSDYDSMRIVTTARKLYQPVNLKLTSEQYMELNRRFAEGFAKFKDEEEIKTWTHKLRAYHDKMDLLGIRDEHIAREESAESTLAFFGLMVMKFFVMLFVVIISGPGIILNAPIGLIAKIISKREAIKAKSKSIVKIHGNDVIASFKLIIGLVVTPILYTIYTMIIWSYFGFFAALLFFMFWPILSYVSLQFVEEGVHIWKSFMALARIRWAGHALKELRRERAEIQKRIRKFVEDLGPKMGKDIWENRIVTKEDIANECSVENGAYSVRQRHKPYVSRTETLRKTQNIIDEDQEDLEQELMFSDQHM